jgi:hypothetical protein
MAIWLDLADIGSFTATLRACRDRYAGTGTNRKAGEMAHMRKQNSLCLPEELKSCGPALNSVEVNGVPQVLIDFPSLSQTELAADTRFCRVGIRADALVQRLILRK